MERCVRTEEVDKEECRWRKDREIWDGINIRDLDGVKAGGIGYLRKDAFEKRRGHHSDSGNLSEHEELTNTTSNAVLRSSPSSSSFMRGNQTAHPHERHGQSAGGVF